MHSRICARRAGYTLGFAPLSSSVRVMTMKANGSANYGPSFISDDMLRSRPINHNVLLRDLSHYISQQYYTRTMLIHGGQ